MPKVSIIIPCYNQSQWLMDAVNSCKNQTFKDIEIIIVNDGSTDNTTEVASQIDGVTLIERHNGGVGAARNTGIKNSRGEYICCLDADDILHEQFVEKTIGISDIVGVGQREFGESNHEYIPPPRVYFEQLKRCNYINCSSLFTRFVWDATGGYAEDMRNYNDWEFWLRATKMGFLIKNVGEILFFYRKHGRSMLTNSIERHEELRQYILKRNALIS